MIDLDKEMEEIQRRGLGNPVPLSRMAKVTAASLDQLASHRAFEFFRDKRFRELAEFDKLSQSEQDRIFNELVLAALTLIMLTLEARNLRVGDDFKEYLPHVRDELPKAHIAYLREAGVAEEHLRLWKKLTKMRYEEYQSDQIKVREAAMQVESQEKELGIEELENIQMLLPVQAVAIGVHHHIRRGKVKGKDELFKHTLRWLSKLYIEVRITVEGGKITLGKKLLVKAKVFLDPLGKRK